MKARVRVHNCGCAVAMLVLGAAVASAQTPTSWTRGASTFGAWPGNGSWNLSAGPEPTDTTEVLIGVNTFSAAAQLLATTGVGNVSGSAAGIIFTNTTAKYFRGQPGNNTNPNDHRLRIASSGLTVTSTSGSTGSVLLGLFVNNSFVPVTPAGTFTFDVNNSQSFTNNSASTLQFGQANATANVFIRPGADSTAGTHAITMSGTGTGVIDVYAVIQDQPADATRIRSLIVNRADATAGAVRLLANNTYSGATTITAGTLLINGTNSGGGGTTVAASGILGGVGSLSGAVTFDSGSKILFNASAPLTLTGAATFNDPSTFGIDDVVGLTSSAANGTYTLISGSVSGIPSLQNFGAGSAYDLGGGQAAYFQQGTGGSLQTVVVPEPSVFACGAAGLVAAVVAGYRVRCRRRR